MTDDIGLIRRKTLDNGVVYFIPLNDMEFFKYKPARTDFETLQIGIVTTPEHSLGDPIPVDLGPYRSELQDAYRKFAEIDARYKPGNADLNTSEIETIAEICALIEEIVSPTHTEMGHA